MTRDRGQAGRQSLVLVVVEPGGVETEWSGIAADEAQRHSGGGGYANYVAKFRHHQAQSGRKPPPEIIVKALKARRPATRYHSGRLAGPLLFLRRMLPDRMLDRLILSAFR